MATMHRQTEKLVCASTDGQAETPCQHRKSGRTTRSLRYARTAGARTDATTEINTLVFVSQQTMQRDGGLSDMEVLDVL